MKWFTEIVEPVLFALLQIYCNSYRLFDEGYS
jgi:hypothetical protein